MRYFISATGTDIGKTYVTQAMCRQARAAKLSVRARKPVASGVAPGDAQSDMALLAAAQGCAVEDVTLYALRAPTSPELAAREEKVVLDWQRILEFCATGKESLQLIEGAGGLFSPLTETQTNADLARALGLPVILVAGSYLGGITHLIATLRAAWAENIVVAGIVLNASEAPHAMHTREVEEALRRLLPEPRLPVLHLQRGVEHLPDMLGWLRAS